MSAFQTMDSQISILRTQITATEAQLASLKSQLHRAESRVESFRQLEAAYHGGFPAEWIGEIQSALVEDFAGAASPDDIARNIRQDSSVPEKQFVTPSATSRWPLSGEEYKRYGRQMIMSEVGLHGQLRLKNAKVLIVGCGGLGCPAAAYLAGAGVGTLGLIDGDVVEVSNLHRQIAHGTGRVGRSKVDSAYEYLKELNPLVKYDRYPSHLTPSAALPIFSKYDLILDCTDHPTSRYLISDASILAGKPLISASALKTEGQLIVLNNPPRAPGDPSGGPCYRCIFPKPPPADSVLSCGEGGILGPVVGAMGVLQALEAIKLLTAKPPAQQQQQLPGESPKASMLLFSAFSNPQFRSIRMRSRHATCSACSINATISPPHLNDNQLDYAAFCGLTHPPQILPATSRIAAAEFARLPRNGTNTLIDTRDETQFAMCALRGSINVPWTGNSQTWIEKALEKGALALHQPGTELYVVCRNGNDSQVAVKAIQDLMAGWPAGERVNDGEQNPHVRIKDIKGGFRAWREEVDAEWPDY